MIVLDASVVVEILTNGVNADSIRAELASSEDSFIVPHLIDIEILSALRRLAAFHRISPGRMKQAVADLMLLPVERYPHTPLVDRIWELRQNFTAYDAAYIALAEATNSVLFTCDEKLRAGHRAQVVLFAQ